MEKNNGKGERFSCSLCMKATLTTDTYFSIVGVFLINYYSFGGLKHQRENGRGKVVCLKLSVCVYTYLLLNQYNFVSVNNHGCNDLSLLRVPPIVGRKIVAVANIIHSSIRCCIHTF